jgi:hypothetical protein
MLRVGYRIPLDLMIRPVARIVRELPPSLSTYRVPFFSTPSGLTLAIVWSTDVVRTKKIQLQLPSVRTLK